MTMVPSDTFYPVYKKKNHHFSPDTFKCAEETVSKLLSQQTTSERPLMLLGKVHIPDDRERSFRAIVNIDSVTREHQFRTIVNTFPTRPEF